MLRHDNILYSEVCILDQRKQGKTFVLNYAEARLAILHIEINGEWLDMFLLFISTLLL
jgi:hypothetical protein